MSVTPENKAAMASIMAAFGDGNIGPMDSGQGHHDIPVAPMPIGADPMMNAIAESFRSAAGNLVDDAEHFPELREALVTTRTPTGARIGNWDIAVRAEPGLGKFYDVTHSVTNDLIASDLRLYEAARSLVKVLNDGKTINSTIVKSILSVEESYARALADAVTFAHRVKVSEGLARDVAEDRYSEAKRRAGEAKLALESLTRLM